MAEESTHISETTPTGEQSSQESQAPISGVGSAIPGSASASSKIGRSGRDTYGPAELTIVMSNYDIGRIDAIQEYPRGSRRSPKLLLRSEKNIYLLKRRAKGKDDPFRVAFGHDLQQYLASRQFPLPRLVKAIDKDATMVQWKAHIYELFEFIKGSSYDNSLDATADSGKVLALFHRLLVDYQPVYDIPQGSYHNSRAVSASLDAIPRSLAQVDPKTIEQGDRVEQVIDFVRDSYNEASEKVNEIGLVDWPMQIVHSDWHPGNMLFRGSKVVAVIDYDVARFQQRIIDVANGALQFSILGGGDDAARWPNYLDESRFKRFLRAYDSVPGSVISRAELRTVPWLMIEALIAESVIPIAATGSFAQMDGVGFLFMIERKVRWIQEHSDRLSTMLDE